MPAPSASEEGAEGEEGEKKAKGKIGKITKVDRNKSRITQEQTLSLGTVYRGIVPGVRDWHLFARKARDAAKTNPRMGNRMTWLGFQPLDEGSRIFIQTIKPANYALTESVTEDGLMQLQVKLVGTKIPRRNERRSIDTSYFDSAISAAQAHQQGSVAVVKIDLHQRVEYRVSQDDEFLMISFADAGVDSQAADSRFDVPKEGPDSKTGIQGSSDASEGGSGEVTVVAESYPESQGDRSQYGRNNTILGINGHGGGSMYNEDNTNAAIGGGGGGRVYFGFKPTQIFGIGANFDFSYFSNADDEGEGSTSVTLPSVGAFIRLDFSELVSVDLLGNYIFGTITRKDEFEGQSFSASEDAGGLHLAFDLLFRADAGDDFWLEFGPYVSYSWLDIQALREKLDFLTFGATIQGHFEFRI
jgi:hypothetical protein